MSREQTWVREVKLHDLDGRGHELRLVKDSRGVLYAEMGAKHDGHLVYSLMRLGDTSEVIAKVAPLR